MTLTGALATANMSERKRAVAEAVAETDSYRSRVAAVRSARVERTARDASSLAATRHRLAAEETDRQGARVKLRRDCLTV